MATRTSAPPLPRVSCRPRFLVAPSTTCRLFFDHCGSVFDYLPANAAIALMLWATITAAAQRYWGESTGPLRGVRYRPQAPLAPARSEASCRSRKSCMPTSAEHAVLELKTSGDSRLSHATMPFKPPPHAHRFRWPAGENGYQETCYADSLSTINGPVLLCAESAGSQRKSCWRTLAKAALNPEPVSDTGLSFSSKANTFCRYRRPRRPRLLRRPGRPDARL